MAKVVVSGTTVEVSSLTDAQIDAGIESMIENDNHAAQNVDMTASARDRFAQYCDLHVALLGRLVAI